MDNRKRDLEELIGVLNAIKKGELEKDICSDYFIDNFPLTGGIVGFKGAYISDEYSVFFVLHFDSIPDNKYTFKVEGDTTKMIEKINSIISEKERELLGEVIQTNSESSKRKRL